jgi:hypothetical protein
MTTGASGLQDASNSVQDTDNAGVYVYHIVLLHACQWGTSASKQSPCQFCRICHARQLNKESECIKWDRAWAPENEAPAQIAEAMYVGGIIMQLNNNGATGGMTNSVQVGNVPREDSAGSNLPLCG